jgi:hypothetical protein
VQFSAEKLDEPKTIPTFAKLFAPYETKQAPRGLCDGAFQGILTNGSVALSSGLVCILRQIAQQFEEVF